MAIGSTYLCVHVCVFFLYVKYIIITTSALSVLTMNSTKYSLLYLLNGYFGPNFKFTLAVSRGTTLNNANPGIGRIGR